MTFTPVTLERFTGLNLIDDPPEVGLSAAIDLLNVDFDRPGQVRQRDGYDNFTAVAPGGRLKAVTPYYTTAGTKRLVVCTEFESASTNEVIAYDTAGAVVHVWSGLTDEAYRAGVRFGTPTSERIYFPPSTSGVPAGVSKLLRYDGTTFTQIAPGVSFLALAVQTSDNRLVGSYADVSPSAVYFSAAGDPETWDLVNDVVQISPGDGEGVNALASWGNLVFAFKETKFAVFYGNSIDATGGVIFNYRMVNSGDGSTGTVCSGRPGVFFLNRRGVYLTTGDTPRLISRAIDPLFLGTLPDTYTGSAINQAQITQASMCWMNERLYVSVPTGSSTTNDRLLIWDSLADQWIIWDIPAAGVCAFRTGDFDELHFAYATGPHHAGRVSSSFTTDDGTAISSFYQPGFFDGGSPEEKKLMRTRVFGSGSVGFSAASDYGSPDTPATLTLGTSPAVDQMADVIARRGRVISPRLSSVSGGAWSVRRLTMYMDSGRAPGMSSS